jgi:diguanylate cyclase (GGDEF)-like protein
MIKNIVFRIVSPVMIVFLIILLSVLYATYLYQQNHLERYTQTILNNISNVFQETLYLETQKTDAALEVIKQNKMIQQAWQAKDRESLLELAKHIFANLKEKQLITHLYFIGLNKKVFLRVHNPEKYGDEILRKTLSNAIQTGQSSKGLEYGIHHNFTLRNVHPWYVDDELIGYIEMGEEIADITGALSRQLNAEIFFTFDKSIYSREQWEQGVELYGHNASWDSLEHSVVLGKTMDSIPAVIEKHLNHQGDEESHYIFHIEIDKKKYSGGFISVKNVQGDSVAKLVVLHDGTEDFNSRKQFMYWLSFISIFTGFSLIFLLYRHVGSIQEVLVKNEKKLIFSANNDPLTKISNRRFFYLSSEEILKAADVNRFFAMIDIDDFKKINDQYGHNVGDECLITFANKTSKLIRKNDIFARIGGEEFILILVDCTFNDVLTKLNLIRTSIKSTVMLVDDKQFTMSVSIGLTTIENSDTDIDACMKRADNALYEAKNAGKDCVKVFRDKL